MEHSAGSWNGYLQRQLAGVAPMERELILTLTVPLVADQPDFRVGWDIKRPGSGRFVAITTGRALWHRSDLMDGATHVCTIMACANEMLEPFEHLDRR